MTLLCDPWSIIKKNLPYNIKNQLIGVENFVFFYYCFMNIRNADSYFFNILKIILQIFLLSNLSESKTNFRKSKIF